MTLEDTLAIADLIIALRGRQAALPDNVRKNIWDRVMEGYCKNCGRKPNSGICNCNKAECKHPTAHLAQSASGNESWYHCPRCGSEW